jgi:hypothetical protein
MKTRKLNQRGFSHFEAILLIVVLVVIGSVGTFVYSRMHKSHAGGLNYANLGTVTWNKTSPNSKAPSTSTKYYTNSNFTFLACAVPAAGNNNVSTVKAVAIAKDYTSYIKSRNYVPDISMLQDKNVSSLGNKWSFGTFSTGNFSMNGAYQIFSKTVPTSSVVSFSPTPTSYWKAVWTKPVAVSKLPNCNGTVPSAPTAPPPVLSKHGFNSPMSIALDSNQNNLYVQNSDYSVVRIDTNNTSSVFAPFTTDNYYYAASPTNPTLVSLFNQNSYWDYSAQSLSSISKVDKQPRAYNKLDGTVLFDRGSAEPITISKDGYTPESVAITTTYGYALWCSTSDHKNCIFSATNLIRNTTSDMANPGSSFGSALTTDLHGKAFFLIQYGPDKNSCGLVIADGSGVSFGYRQDIPCGCGVIAVKGFFNNFNSPEVYIIDNNNTIIDYDTSSGTYSVIQ